MAVWTSRDLVYAGRVADQIDGKGLHFPHDQVLQEVVHDCRVKNRLRATNKEHVLKVDVLAERLQGSARSYELG